MIDSIGIIGYGNMGSAMAKGVREHFPKRAIFVAEPDPAKGESARVECGAELIDSPEELINRSQIILIAIKPQYLESVLPLYRPYSAGKAVISIAAGVKLDYFQEALETDQVVRFMPNLAAQVGKSLVGVSPAATCTPEFRAQALAVAEAVGGAVELPESSLAAFTGLCGSGIAYVFAFLHALALGGTKEGIAYPTSLEIALGTLEGACALVRESGEHPVSLLSKVISPGGTTIQGVDALEEGGFTAAVIDAVERAGRRARELE